MCCGGAHATVRQSRPREHAVDSPVARGDEAPATMAQTVPNVDFGADGRYAFPNFDLSILEDCEVPTSGDFEVLYYNTTSPTMFPSPGHGGDASGEPKKPRLEEDDGGGGGGCCGRFVPPCSLRGRPCAPAAALGCGAVLDPPDAKLPFDLLSCCPPGDAHAAAGFFDLEEILEENRRLRLLVQGAGEFGGSLERREQAPLAEAEGCCEPPTLRGDGLPEGLLGAGGFELRPVAPMGGRQGAGKEDEAPAAVSEGNGGEGLRFPAHLHPAEAKRGYSALKRCLGDQSYISRYNHDPRRLEKIADIAVRQETVELDRGGAAVPFGEIPAHEFYPVLKIALEQVAREMQAACLILDIPPEPLKWSEENVTMWLMWATQQCGLPELNLDNFRVDGVGLAALSEEDFRQRALQGGEYLYAYLDVWINSQCQQKFLTQVCLPASPPNKDQQQHAQGTPPCLGGAGGLKASDRGSSDSAVESEDEEDEYKNKSGSHIHLWQFLKELLSQQPQQQSPCIKWVDRQSGVFKIEDSVQVAKLWGKRKNRPAMNYDKLSRSIRQYYKKGIMKKTERSQRLVYQFCHPYCL